jgi:hypothetical protein
MHARKFTRKLRLSQFSLYCYRHSMSRSTLAHTRSFVMLQVAAGCSVDRSRDEYESTAVRAEISGTAVAPSLVPTSLGDDGVLRFEVTTMDVRLDWPRSISTTLTGGGGGAGGGGDGGAGGGRGQQHLQRVAKTTATAVNATNSRAVMLVNPTDAEVVCAVTCSSKPSDSASASESASPCLFVVERLEVVGAATLSSSSAPPSSTLATAPATAGDVEGDDLTESVARQPDAGSAHVARDMMVVRVPPRASLAATVRFDTDRIVSLTEGGGFADTVARYVASAELVFDFTDGSRRVVPVVGVLHRPLLSLSSSSSSSSSSNRNSGAGGGADASGGVVLAEGATSGDASASARGDGVVVDFGTVRSASSREIVLSNRGRSAAPWTVACTNDGGDGAFTVVGPTQGMLDAWSSHTATTTATLTVRFNPSAALSRTATKNNDKDTIGSESGSERSAVLTVRSPVHPDVSIVLRGVGTLDERFA